MSICLSVLYGSPGEAMSTAKSRKPVPAKPRGSAVKQGNFVKKDSPASQGGALNHEALTQAAECLRTLAHPHRLKMIQLMLGDVQYTVTELAELCDISQPQTSEHLRLMQRCGFLNGVRDGRTVYYEITEPHLAKIMACIEQRFGNPS